MLILVGTTTGCINDHHHFPQVIGLFNNSKVIIYVQNKKYQKMKNSELVTIINSVETP